ncbi:uncharacterized protein LOC122499219 [Leptopilina heterotoma]|uniref:uncharacterized protein LOC122499219 n=1 Tax=Leptopilina heterotoma TaxID=63436 RepID=UPI001CA8EAAF|nr:uncharacterized protein LOC122499219 [Leptopilina heterotoma]
MKWNEVLVVLWIIFSPSIAVSSSWRPVVPSSQLSIFNHDSSSLSSSSSSIYGNSPFESENYFGQENDQCALYKVSMNQQLYFEYIQYKIDFPSMKEFTLCMWTKFKNHTNEHPLFSYAVGIQPRGILSWVANTARSSYYMLNIDGHNLYRLNYPLRLNKWYHSCQSWNGHTGEWQIWVNDERVGRGFNNRLVGHVIKGGGVAISGQEQRQLGGGFLEGEGAPPGSGGMLGEITMVQLYGVALTAGKAHRDHKHHHVHHYEHDTSNNVPPSTTQAPVTGPPLPMNPYLTGGQINHQVKINPGSHLQIVKNGVTLRHPTIPVPQVPAQQPFPPSNPIPMPTVSPSQNLIPGFLPVLNSYKPQQPQFFSNKIPQIPSLTSSIANPVNGFNFIDRRYRHVVRHPKSLSKRDNPDERAEGKNSSTEDDDKVAFMTENIFGKKNVTKRESEIKRKRALVHLSDGSIVDDALLLQQNLGDDYFSGLANFGAALKTPESKEEEREPAEGEVRQVMDICDGCAGEPFERALIFGWRSVSKKLYSGAMHIPTVPVCKSF